MLEEISFLDCNKNGTFKNIPSSRLNEMLNVFEPNSINNYNDKIVNQNQFPDKLKLC